MPVCSLHVLALHTSIPSFLSVLASQSPPIKPLLASKPLRWIVRPTSTSTSLLGSNATTQDPNPPSNPWDLVIVLPLDVPLPVAAIPFIAQQFSVTVGVPSSRLKQLAEGNDQLLHPPGGVPQSSGERTRGANASSSQSLELSNPLQQWIAKEGNGDTRGGAVSMLNLLSFNKGKKTSYQQYGAAFASKVGNRHGGNAKIVGTVISINGSNEKNRSDTEGGMEWDEIAIAHYPSLTHFADMISSKDYQEVNQKHRLGALRDTFILCTSELRVEEELKKAGAARL
ncbi:hypothetical protein P152DRAFT_394995 [Eremomyces bilateralis CBS 781.70]|uniref:DUF1330 domain-containing protein n=1 Tax=Eremomyces bilateralis CBS 781.70 TaxID=1392243 RepID=A0A6G1G5G8_9PEZI|nr:uncharacterized protein P152DRAFT_394995 [Eremomyces bilateralis CBS 781.70]KAF1813140.1 hypothetical protein P152DRAFT_394995 [Eremomyces bilateralis CBS 781.70]